MSAVNTLLAISGLILFALAIFGIRCVLAMWAFYRGGN
jgi:hypothetical protein